MPASKKLSGWNRYPVQQCVVVRPERYVDLAPSGKSTIARGQGRSYGDASLNGEGRVVLTERVNRFLDFDKQQGKIKVEAGAKLSDINNVIISDGWFLPVTPGTQNVSVGGCVAADVHGKNHHRFGSFGNYIDEIELIIANHQRLKCSPRHQPELFWATVGGMGMTGIIGDVCLKLMPIESRWMVVDHRPTVDLDGVFQLLEDPAYDDLYTVAWVDCMSASAFGRGVVMRAHHATSVEIAKFNGPELERKNTTRVLNIPFDFPNWTLNAFAIRLFNDVYYRRLAKRTQPELVSHERYFYPLDKIHQWNRMYGRRGFLQYQCVLPEPAAREGAREIIERSRGLSFLTVLKRLGEQNDGPLSFAMRGYTIAMDFPIQPGVFKLLNEIDEIVIKHGGRVYLAKDARLRPETFRAMYPKYREWLRVKRTVDPENIFSSDLSRRLAIGEY